MRINYRSLIIFLLLVVIFYSFQRWQQHQQKTVPVMPTPFPQRKVSPAGSASTSAVLGVQTKTDSCIASGGLPDTACTPGAIFTDATVQDICTKGYSKTVRNVPVALKRKVYDEYGISSHVPGEYEVDHLISLELGGSNDIANLWPELAEPTPGFHEKDLVENYLHDQVCKGTMTLEMAQQQIAKNWLETYQNAKDLQKYNYK